MIGIIGGVGPYAGLDLMKKIFDITLANKDQDHLPVIMISVPHRIVDRTEFLLGRTQINPGEVLSELACKLVDAGAQFIGIPCNTAHVPKIFNIIRDRLDGYKSNVILVNMIDEVGKYINEFHNEVRKVGVLSTTGTLKTNIYPNLLKYYEIESIQVDNEIQNNCVQPAIYDPIYGIKSHGNPISKRAHEDLLTSAMHLIRKGAEAIILGCTEIGLSITDNNIENAVILDSTKILARALIKLVDPKKLR